MEEERFNLDDAWSHFSELTRWLIVLFGAPAAIAARMILRRATRADILQWLAPLEALARRLLLIEAAEQPRPNFVPRRANTGRIVSALRDAPAAPLSENAAEWRVRFNVWTGAIENRRAGATPQPIAAGAIKYNAVPLAKRIEALLRLTEQRAAYVARLARRIAAAPQAAQIAFAAFPHNAGPAASPLAAAQAQADRVLARFADSS